jgi:triosephosphate isomerase
MIIASNFKTNHTRKSTKEYLEKLNSFVKENSIKEDILVFPTATSLDNFLLEDNIEIGVQNAYPTEKGSFTGELGLEQLNEFDIKTILIGHSERRHILKESQELITQKYDFFKTQNYKIVYCIGEPKEVREEGLEAVLEYNFSQLEDIDINYENLIVAYEPVWAIGTGLTASNEQIEETLTALRKTIKAPLLYGGSVKPANTKDILSIPNCDGILVGTASWDVENFKEMVKIANEL